MYIVLVILWIQSKSLLFMCSFYNMNKWYVWFDNFLIDNMLIKQ